MSTTIRADEVEDGDVISIEGHPLSFSVTSDYRDSHIEEEVTYTVNPKEKRVHPLDKVMTIGIHDGYFDLPEDYPVELIGKRKD